ncbi:hypothetical protein BKA67DRAFT_538754 [Truncatella angustata]|uniref:EthD domain-containing protein n=1 Tax=Truncatella angustata TaxID=152316 RepID=A0A9P8UEZ1_9PEZI|nr:uncharacterized protein BKA67DRAFT_538754 [Truncatella angustata]KAH6648737.1 hypothetical protein BKA67DRAFT_538754 [Truncatella angustata]KAH8199734.1 hypothetical protein TruAng_006079 [Truncatella angustata]
MAPAPERLLRLSIAHFKKPNVTDEDFHRWATEEHCVRAAAIHAKHGVQTFDMLFSLKPARDQVQKLNERLGGKWVVDNHDVVVEFYVRDIEAVEGIINDPDFQKLQSEEAPWIDAERDPIGASLGWVEVYVEQGKAVNVTKDDKPAYEKLDLGGDA